MPEYSILIHPDKRLRRRAAEVREFDDSLHETVANMFATMYRANGIGLAATQVNIHQRIVVMDVPQVESQEEREQKSETTAHDKLVLVNPEIIDFSEELAEFEEGCLSLPGQYAPVIRPAKIRVRYRDPNGQSFEREASGLLGVCIQHEVDHLNGVLFIDHLSRLKRERLEKKLAKSLKEEARHG